MQTTARQIEASDTLSSGRKWAGISKENIRKIWPEVFHLISPACGRSHGRMTAPVIFDDLCLGHRQLWVVHFNDKIEACFVTEIIYYPESKNCRLIIGTGKGRQYWQHWRCILEKWAKSIGCKYMEVFARKGWQRIFIDYECTHYILEKEL